MVINYKTHVRTAWHPKGVELTVYGDGGKLLVKTQAVIDAIRAIYPDASAPTSAYWRRTVDGDRRFPCYVFVMEGDTKAIARAVNHLRDTMSPTNSGLLPESVA
jgi:hypothetical protein